MLTKPYNKIFILTAVILLLLPLANASTSNLGNVSANGWINASQDISTKGHFVGHLDWSWLENIPSYLVNWTSTIFGIQQNITNLNSRVDDLNLSKLDKTDQRYNESSLIDSLNNSKLDKTDQRYNESSLFDDLNNSKLDKTDQRYNESSGIDALNNSKLDKTDQRYNESSGIDSLNSSKIDKTSESSLNVNSSDYWDDLNKTTDIRVLQGVTISTVIPAAFSNNSWNFGPTAIFLNDSRYNRIHSLNGELVFNDEMRKNTLLSDVNVTYFTNASGIYAYIVEYYAQNIIVNINGKTTRLNYNNATVKLVSGTNSTPIVSWIMWENEDNPTLVVNTTTPAQLGNYALLAKNIIGDGSNIYAAANMYNGNNGFIAKVSQRFRIQGLLYNSGFVTTANTTDVAIGTGSYMYITDLKDTITNVSVLNGFFYINVTNSYVQSNNLNAFTKYADGTTISGGKYFNVVYGIVLNQDGVVRMMALVQNYPSVEYGNIDDAEADKFGATIGYPTQTDLKYGFLPVARVVIKKGATNLQQILSNGQYFKDLRGSVGLIQGGASGVGSHSSLSNLAWSVAGHTFDTNLNVAPYNITATYINARINYSSIDNVPNATASGVTSVTRGFGFNNSNTSITSTGTLDINDSVFQRRFGASCTYGIGYVDQDGTVHCSAQQDYSYKMNDTAADVLRNYASIQSDPQGFPDLDNTDANLHSTLAFNTTTRNFTITPVGTNYSYYFKGVLKTQSTQKSIVITDTSGAHIIYFDANGVLQDSATLTSDILCNQVIVAAIVWDAGKGIQYIVQDERHTHFMECNVHQYLHEHLGTQYDSGLAPQFITSGTTSLNSSAQLNVTSGAISDEDFEHNIANYSSNTGGKFRVYYQLGPTNNWSIKTADDYPFIWCGGSVTYPCANNRPAYNLNTAGVWTLTQTSANNNVVLIHFFATNSIEPTRDVIVVLGQTQYTSAALATTGATTEIQNILGSGLFATEFKPLYSVLVSNAAASNGPHAIFLAPTTGSYIDWRRASLSGSSGTILAGTVTTVATGTGLTGGPITSSGTISIDDTYIQQFNASYTGLNASSILNPPWMARLSNWPASNITNGTFGNGNYIFPSSLQVGANPNTNLYMKNGSKIILNRNLDAAHNWTIYNSGAELTIASQSGGADVVGMTMSSASESINLNFNTSVPNLKVPQNGKILLNNTDGEKGTLSYNGTCTRVVGSSLTFAVC